MTDFVDLCGIPEFFITSTRIEDAGYGMVREVGCINRGNHVLPVVSIVQPAVTVLQMNRELELIVRQIIRGDNWQN